MYLQYVCVKNKKHMRLVLGGHFRPATVFTNIDKHSCVCMVVAESVNLTVAVDLRLFDCGRTFIGKEKYTGKQNGVHGVFNEIGFSNTLMG